MMREEFSFFFRPILFLTQNDQMHLPARTNLNASDTKQMVLKAMLFYQDV